MARKEDRKRQKLRLKEQKLRLKEQKRAAERARYLAEMQRKELYPRIIFDETEGEKEFVTLIKDAVASIDFDSPEMGPDWMRQFYQDIRSSGPRSAILQLRERAMEQRLSPTYPSLEASSVRTKFGCVSSAPAPDDPRIDPDGPGVHLGDRIFKKIGPVALARYIPQSDLSVVYRSHELLIRFSSLLQEKGEHGTVYYSRHKPTIDIAGKPRIVAFSRHAIERLQQRRAPTVLEYGVNGDLHTHLAKNIYQEVVTLPTGQTAFCIFDACEIPGYRVRRDYFENVFGGESKKVLGAGACHYRLGYFPVVIEGDFAKATTMLFPGFTGTPEYRLVESKPKYRIWLEEAEESSAAAFYEGPRCIEIIKWLHDNGYPQVVQIKQKTTVHGRPRDHQRRRPSFPPFPRHIS
jgi:hypothetical protein